MDGEMDKEKYGTHIKTILFSFRKKATMPSMRKSSRPIHIE